MVDVVVQGPKPQPATRHPHAAQLTLAFEWRELKLSDPDVVKMAKSNTKESKEAWPGGARGRTSWDCCGPSFWCSDGRFRDGYPSEPSSAWGPWNDERLVTAIIDHHESSSVNHGLNHQPPQPLGSTSATGIWQ